MEYIFQTRKLRIPNLCLHTHRASLGPQCIMYICIYCVRTSHAKSYHHKDCIPTRSKEMRSYTFHKTTRTCTWIEHMYGLHTLQRNDHA